MAIIGSSAIQLCVRQDGIEVPYFSVTTAWFCTESFENGSALRFYFTCVNIYLKSAIPKGEFWSNVLNSLGINLKSSVVIDIYIFVKSVQKGLYKLEDFRTWRAFYASEGREVNFWWLICSLYVGKMLTTLTTGLKDNVWFNFRHCHSNKLHDFPVDLCQYVALDFLGMLYLRQSPQSSYSDSWFKNCYWSGWCSTTANIIFNVSLESHP